jgi:hypothetical protein
MIVYNINSGGLYDKDEITGQISKVLRCFHTEDSVTFDRFNYVDNGEYRKPTEKELKYGSCEYYLEDSSRLLKIKNCITCDDQHICNHNERYYRYKQPVSRLQGCT